MGDWVVHYWVYQHVPLVYRMVGSCMFIPLFVITDDSCPFPCRPFMLVLVFVPEEFSRRSRAASPVTGKVMRLTLLRWWSTGRGQAGVFLIRLLVFGRVARLTWDFGLVSKFLNIIGSPKLCKWPARLNNSTNLLAPIHLGALIRARRGNWRNMCAAWRTNSNVCPQRLPSAQKAGLGPCGPLMVWEGRCGAEVAAVIGRFLGRKDHVARWSYAVWSEEWSQQIVWCN